MGPADYHSSTGLDAGNACFRNGSQDHGHHTHSQPPELATFACAYALADACTSTVPISRRTFSDLLSARRGGGGGYYTKVMNQVYRLPVLESRHTNGETRRVRVRVRRFSSPTGGEEVREGPPGDGHGGCAGVG